MAQMVKNLPAIQYTRETQVWFLGLEDPLEEGMVTHSSMLAWKIPWTEEPRRLQSMGPQSQSRLSDKANTHPIPATTALIQAYASAINWDLCLQTGAYNSPLGNSHHD